jgi:hypothetical protein
VGANGLAISRAVVLDVSGAESRGGRDDERDEEDKLAKEKTEKL